MTKMLPDIRKKVWDRDRHKCHYCNRRVSLDEMTLDHMIPKAHGGNNYHRNLCASCAPCNGAKGNMTDTEFMAIKHQDREEMRKNFIPAWKEIKSGRPDRTSHLEP